MIFFFNPGVTELMTKAGAVHEIPPEVVDQAEESTLDDVAARWAFKANLIDRAELSEAIGC